MSVHLQTIKHTLSFHFTPVQWQTISWVNVNNWTKCNYHYLLFTIIHSTNNYECILCISQCIYASMHLLVFVFLVWCFSSDFSIFHSYGDVTIAGEGLQIMTCSRHSWPLSIEGSLTCQNYCVTEHPFFLVISEVRWHAHLSLSV